ncbi:MULTISPECIES: conjugal transfer protein TrbF [Sphingopyxis]|uniref:Conjugal transfer protein TrbF n=1 Tax=Sphingopyxis granuli TaxID=267128 RepID=A0AA86L4G8_9SPHN|nr:conjugal transfer protein TrbF [Sphingopyxis granuli]AMG74887.1 Conjugal transfer protein TrbF [Sphingopyxis granuli]
MKFKRAVQRYGQTPEPEPHHQRGSQAWDDRLGSARVQAYNWRLMAFGGLLLATGLSATLIWQSMQSRVIPYVVAVDNLGQAQAIAPATKDYRPTDPQIMWHLGRFVANVRSRSLDPVLMRQNWLSAYDYATERASLFLGEYARASNPFADVGHRTVSVQVTSVVRASDTSFQVKWTEQAYERGSLASTSRWTAILTVKMQPPRSADVLRKNPLGVYVDAIDWSQELETPAGRATPQPQAATAPPADMSLDTEQSPQTPERNEP